jgi:hypothetical protein
MTFAFVQYLPGYTEQDYDRVLACLDGPAAEGLLVHIAGPCRDGWRIIQVWRDETSYLDFEPRLWRAVRRSGTLDQAAPPLVELLDVTHLVIPDGTDGSRTGS